MRAKRLNGFTLVELIVIVSVLFLTVAVLYPILAAAQSQDRNTRCLHNMKRCSQALKMYSDDYDGGMPSSGVPYASPTQSQVVDFLTAPGTLPFAYPHTRAARTWPEILWDYLPSANVVVCPCDRPRGRVSYWYKYVNDLAWRDPAYRRQKMADYGYESDQIAFYEHAGWHTGDAGGIKNGVKINAAFIDTHVQMITVTSGPTAYPPASDERSGASAIRLGLPMYYNCSVGSNQVPTVHSLGDCIDPSSSYDQL